MLSFTQVIEILLTASVSGSNPHIHNPGGDPVPGWAYNFRQSGMVYNISILDRSMD